MKLVIAQGCVVNGKPAAKGAEVEVDSKNDAQHLLASGSAVKPGSDAAKRVAEEVAAAKKAGTKKAAE